MIAKIYYENFSHKLIETKALDRYIYVKDINIKAEQKTCTNNIVDKKISNYQKDASAKGKAQLSEKDSQRICKELLC